MAMPMSAEASAGGVVDPVAHHGDRAVALTKALDRRHRVVGLQLGLVLDPELARDGPRRPVVVAGEHDDVLDAGALERRQCCRRVRARLDAKGRADPRARQIPSGAR